MLKTIHFKVYVRASVQPLQFIVSSLLLSSLYCGLEGENLVFL